MTYYAALEAGGTKFNCAIFDSERNLIDSARIPTQEPEQTLADTLGFFTEHQNKGIEFVGAGIASFGPLDLDTRSPTYGAITVTPKPHWSHTQLVTPFKEALGCPVAIDTDVNGAALAESRYGAGKGKDVVVYVTVGTGVGGGVVIHGKPLHGLVHPEIGHMRVEGHPHIQSQCPFHENCVEGLASGNSMGKIWQQPAETLPDDHIAWDIEAQILGQLCHNLMMSFSPQKLILGGGVMAKPGLLKNVVKHTQTLLGGYLALPSHTSLEYIIVSPGLGDKSGLMGAFALAQAA